MASFCQVHFLGLVCQEGSGCGLHHAGLWAHAWKPLMPSCTYGEKLKGLESHALLLCQGEEAPTGPAGDASSPLPPHSTDSLHPHSTLLCLYILLRTHRQHAWGPGLQGGAEPQRTLRAAGRDRKHSKVSEMPTAPSLSTAVPSAVQTAVCPPMPTLGNL